MNRAVSLIVSYYYNMAMEEMKCTWIAFFGVRVSDKSWIVIWLAGWNIGLSSLQSQRVDGSPILIPKNCSNVDNINDNIIKINEK
jgi:hypothetical protein